MEAIDEFFGSFISGYFITSKKVDTIYDYFCFLKKQLPRVIIPYLIWSICYLIKDAIHGVSIGDMLISLFTFQTAAPFYFIFLIIQFYFLLPILNHINFQSWIGVIQSGLISLICCLSIFYIRYYTDIELPLMLYAGTFPTWLVFFVLGMHIKKNGVQIKRYALIILMMLSLILSIIETFLQFKEFGNIGDAVTTVKASSFIYSTFVILFLFKGFKTKIFIKNIINIGEKSFGIYLSHMLILPYIIGLLKFVLPFSLKNVFVFEIATVLITISFCLIGGQITCQLNKKSSKKYLGY